MAARSRVVQVLLAGAVGVISGIYIWKPLLEQELKEGPKGLEQLSKERASLTTSSPPPATTETSATSAQPAPSPSVQQEPAKNPVNPIISSQVASKAQPEPSFKRDVGEDQSVSVLSWSRWFGGSSPSSPAANSDPKKS
ncbi:hypothetical protein FRC04_008834 [Tulasnella sp. 424]|nr:hypothetical protein FRC04_008834 [Tulasnella sp. 424]KAG8980062.1 hypothetical protein FRC05_007505 [Tulasnella sp. 425]